MTLSTHPVNRYTEGLDRDVLVEFDATGEFHGQGVIANTFPQVFVDRWRHFQDQDNVIGYVARTDRFGDTGIVGTPTEINLYALERAVEDETVTAGDVYAEFAARRYGEAAAVAVEGVLRSAYDVVTSTMYTLGTNIANHSKLDYDPYCSSYYRHVSGKWLDPPLAHVEHTVRALRRLLDEERYAELAALWERTVLTARLHRAVAKAYFGYRVYVNDADPRRREQLAGSIWDGLDEATAVARQIRDYAGPVPVGQWNWRGDADQADLYRDRIANGWDKYGGIAVPRPDRRPTGSRTLRVPSSNASSD